MHFTYVQPHVHVHCCTWACKGAMSRQLILGKSRWRIFSFAVGAKCSLSKHSTAPNRSPCPLCVGLNEWEARKCDGRPSTETRWHWGHGPTPGPSPTFPPIPQECKRWPRDTFHPDGMSRVHQVQACQDVGVAPSETCCMCREYPAKKALALALAKREERRREASNQSLAWCNKFCIGWAVVSEEKLKETEDSNHCIALHYIGFALPLPTYSVSTSAPDQSTHIIFLHIY